MVMNEQDLKQIINESVLDKIHFEFVQALPLYCWVAGGSIIDSMIGKEINDVDIFFASEQDKFETVKHVLKNEGQIIKTWDKGVKINIKNFCCDFISYENVKTPKECVESFDFTVCGVAVDKNGEIFYSDNFLNDYNNKLLRHTGTHLPLARNKAARALKYVNKGFSFDEETQKAWIESFTNNK